MNSAPGLAASKDTALLKCLPLLRRFLRARTGDPLLNPDDLSPLESMIREHPYFSADVPRVLLTGKFKTGKSTLINALVGADVAATDVFEMTSWIARYWPSSEPFCRLVYRNGTEQASTASNFARRCQSRDFTPEELEQIARVDIGTGSTPLSVTIIDAPGSGSMDRQNERRLVAAFEDADLIAWVADITALGDARESALIKTLLDQDAPVVVILTKCDFADDSEIKEAMDFLRFTYLLSKMPIFATAAIKSDDPGIGALRNFLNHDIVSRHAALRAQAQAAHHSRILGLAVHLLDRVYGELSYWSNSVSRFSVISGQISEIVQSQLEREIDHFVRVELFGDRRDQLAAALQKTLADGKGALSEDRISEVFSSILGPRYLEDFWVNLREHVRGAGSGLWKEKIKDRLKELDECCGAFREDVFRHVGTEIDETQIRAQAGEIAYQQAGMVISGTAILATAGTITALGNGTFAAALTGIGLPIAATGAAITAALYFIQRQRATDSIRAQAKAYLDDCTEAFLQDVVHKRFFPDLRHVNQGIAVEMVSAFKDAIAGRLPHENLENLLAEVAQCRASLT
jgi:GTP-binding protein EngB required for normal cell division